MPRPRKQTNLDAAIAAIVSRAATEIAQAVRRSIADSIGLSLHAPMPAPRQAVAATTAPKRKRRLTPEGRKRLSENMKARWVARRAAKAK